MPYMQGGQKRNVILCKADKSEMSYYARRTKAQGHICKADKSGMSYYARRTKRNAIYARRTKASCHICKPDKRSTRRRQIGQTHRGGKNFTFVRAFGVPALCRRVRSCPLLYLHSFTRRTAKARQSSQHDVNVQVGLVAIKEPTLLVPVPALLTQSVPASKDWWWCRSEGSNSLEQHARPINALCSRVEPKLAG